MNKERRNSRRSSWNSRQGPVAIRVECKLRSIILATRGRHRRDQQKRDLN